ncbi:MAG: hypothetical protein ACRD3T_01195, partial [Terriglobia bacterium]
MPEDLLNEFAPHRPENVSILEILVARAQRNDFSEDLNEAITMLDGTHPALRGKHIGGLFEDLALAARQGRQHDDHAILSAELRKVLNEEFRDVSEQYQTYLQDKVEVSRARRKLEREARGRAAEAGAETAQNSAAAEGDA